MAVVSTRYLLTTVLVCSLVRPSPGLAQGLAPDLSQVSIEDLMNIEITSASRKEQRAADVAAAVFVITQDDIRRSGMMTIPDLLRLVPGVEVAQLNSNKWAVSMRGFNGLYANKLLVLVDGRSVYNRIFSGVFWDAEDLMLDDIDRIEVIRGPGAATWGANAVNGVINIVTKSAVGDEPPALAIIDWMMPKLDGIELCRRISGASLRSPVYVILLTARNSRQDLVAGLEAGADDYLTKPFDPDELRARIHVGQRTLGLIANIKRLTGLLPICSYCKRIRSDHDYWEQVESYITEHTDALFSHGICPSCLATALEELDEHVIPPPKSAA